MAVKPVQVRGKKLLTIKRIFNKKISIATYLIPRRDLYYVAIPTDVSLLSLGNKRRSRVAGLQRMTETTGREIRVSAVNRNFKERLVYSSTATNTVSLVNIYICTLYLVTFHNDHLI